jgi:hypothetical protein
MRRVSAEFARQAQMADAERVTSAPNLQKRVALPKIYPTTPKLDFANRVALSKPPGRYSSILRWNVSHSEIAI